MSQKDDSINDLTISDDNFDLNTVEERAREMEMDYS